MECLTGMESMLRNTRSSTPPCPYGIACCRAYVLSTSVLFKKSQCSLVCGVGREQVADDALKYLAAVEFWPEIGRKSVALSVGTPSSFYGIAYRRACGLSTCSFFCLKSGVWRGVGAGG